MRRIWLVLHKRLKISNNLGNGGHYDLNFLYSFTNATRLIWFGINVTILEGYYLDALVTSQQLLKSCSLTTIKYLEASQLRLQVCEFARFSDVEQTIIRYPPPS